MSKETTMYLESLYDKFVSSESGEIRNALLDELKSNGFSNQADLLRDQWYKERVDYATEHFGSDEILSDETGDFVIDIDSYDEKFTRYYLPDYLNEYYICK